MAKRSNDEWNNELEDTQEFNSLYPELVESETVRLQLMKDLSLTILGKVTSKIYTFSGGGSIVDVDKKDADIMLTKTSGNGCCPGSEGSTPYFSIAR